MSKVTKVTVEKALSEAAEDMTNVMLEVVADIIAKDIFKCGDLIDFPAVLIKFETRISEIADETDQEGLCETALAKVIFKSLKENLNVENS